MARFDEITPETAFTRPYTADERVTAFLRAVYGWMAAGLAITAARRLRRLRLARRS